MFIGALLAKFAIPIWLNIVGLVVIGVGALIFWVMGAFRQEHHV
jgi:hypothetical protein